MDCGSWSQYAWPFCCGSVFHLMTHCGANNCIIHLSTVVIGGGGGGEAEARSKQKAASSKQQAASSKQQAASSKQQAAGSKQQAASMPAIPSRPQV